jgi:hypothetical protein
LTACPNPHYVNCLTSLVGGSLEKADPGQKEVLLLRQLIFNLDQTCHGVSTPTFLTLR